MTVRLKKVLCVVLCFLVLVAALAAPPKKAEAFAVTTTVAVVGLVGVLLCAYGVALHSDSDAFDFSVMQAEHWLQAQKMTASTYLLQLSTNLISGKPLADYIFNQLAANDYFTKSDLNIPSITDSLTIYSEGGSFAASSVTFSTPEYASYTINSHGYPFCIYPYSWNYLRIYTLSPQVLEISRVLPNGQLETSSISSNIHYLFSSSSDMYYCSINVSDTTSLLGYLRNLLVSLGVTEPRSSFASSVLHSGDLPSAPDTSSKGVEILGEGAKDYYDSMGSIEGYELDAPDVLGSDTVADRLGIDDITSVGDLVASGELSIDDVIGALDCQPYINVDVNTGEISAVPTDTTIPVALDKDLSIPAEIDESDKYDKKYPDLPRGKFTFDISKFFPFCLPFDLYDILVTFKGEPKPPVFTVDLSFIGEYSGVDTSDQDYLVTIDLTDWEDAAVVVRGFLVIIFCVGLIFVSYKLIHGD